MKLAKESKIEDVNLFEDFYPRLVRIRKNLSNNFKRKLINFLKKYDRCFAWIATNMLGIDPKIAYCRMRLSHL